MSTWADISARMGRNDMPHAAIMGFYDLDDDAERAVALSAAWTMAEWPELHADQEVWADLFAAVGPVRDGEPVDYDGLGLPDPVTLYRGAVPSRRDGMSWTTDRDRAEWFARRFDGLGTETGQVYEITIPVECCLARFTEGRGEDEVVVDVTQLDMDAEVSCPHAA